MVTAQTFRKRTGLDRNRQFARAMRHEAVECEKQFWWRVRNRALGGYKFKRQVLIGSYIADFVCIERMLIVELDGSQHVNRKSYDEKRDAFLQSKGFRVIRIWDSYFLENPDGVMDMTLRDLETAPSLPSEKTPG
jgi:very-short-patch-repair endonuclease